MKDELDALTKNHTWDLVTLPPRQSVVSCKQIYKIKTSSDASIEHYKARLVAKSFTQEYGIDYDETFTPIARISSVRALLAVTAASKWNFFQMDVKNAFLNGDLSKEVYMHLFLVFLLNQTRFVAFDVHFMALNKLHELGLPSSASPSFAWVTLSVLMILPYFFVALIKAPFCFSYMWMI